MNRKEEFYLFNDRFDLLLRQTLIVVLDNQFVQATSQGLKHQACMYTIYSPYCKMVKKTNDFPSKLIVWCCFAYHFQEANLIGRSFCIMSRTFYNLQCHVFLASENLVNVNPIGMVAIQSTHSMSRHSQTVEK